MAVEQQRRVSASIRRRGSVARGALGLLALLAAVGTIGCGTADAKPRRIVLVTIDTLRADHVGSYGSAHAVTPTIDAVGAAGVRFETAISPAPLTLPAHATLMTGLDPPRHGVHDNATYRLAEDTPILAEQLRELGFSTGAFVGAVVLERRYGLARGFDVYDDGITQRAATGADGFAERSADRVVDAALRWLPRGDAPFFLWVHLFDPHADYVPPAPFAERFAAAPYVGEIAFADLQLGRLLDEIGRRWPDGGTVTVVTSDHGESLGEHWESSHALTIYDATQRVPLVMSGPGLPVGRVVPDLVRLADVAPTILGLLGAEPAPDIDGRDLRPLLDGTETTARIAYLETLVPHFDFEMSPLYGIRTDSFKYIRAPEPELYDLRSDPGETQNLGALRVEAERLDRILSERLIGARPITPGETPDESRRAQLESLGYVVEPSAPTELVLGEVGGLDPKEGVPLFTLGRRTATLIAADRAPEALALLRRYPGASALAELLRAHAANRAGDFDAAERYARAVLASGELEPDGWIQLAQAFEGRGRLAEASDAYAEAARIDATLAAVALGRGRLAEASGDRIRARAFYRDAASEDPEARWRLAALRLEAGDVKGADALLGDVPRPDQDAPAAALRLARAEIAAGLIDRARERVAAALRSHPDHPELRAMVDPLRTAE